MYLTCKQNLLLLELEESTHEYEEPAYLSTRFNLPRILGKIAQGCSGTREQGTFVKQHYQGRCQELQQKTRETTLKNLFCSRKLTMTIKI